MNHGSSDPVISVIVPVYNAAGTIEGLLQSFERLMYDRDKFEILLVDNGSTDTTLCILKNFSDQFQGKVTVLVEGQIEGSYAARNKGLEKARGEILAFTDADCRVDSGWLEVIERQLMRAGHNVILGGNVVLVPANKCRPTAVEMYEMVLGFSQEANVLRRGYSVTANLATWRDVFGRVGPFQALKSKGDFEWSRRASRSGVRVIYESTAIVRHPARRTIAELVTKTRRVTGGQFDLRNTGRSNVERDKLGFLEQLKRVMTNEKFFAWHQKLRVLLVAVAVLLVKTVELFRLRLGGSSERL